MIALLICFWADYTQAVCNVQMREPREGGVSLARGWADALPSWPLWAALFALAYGQSPLFTSNQNQYFLHGLAQAGFGNLAVDWLANTVDPTPVFTALVRLTASLLPPAAFYLEYGLLLALYFVSLRAIILTDEEALRSSDFRRTLTSLGLVGLHAGAFRLLLSRTLGPEAAFLFEGGLAGQRLLGTVLQPSSFGVFLIASVALFLRDRPYAAAAAAAVAATVHPTYLLAAGAITLGYLWVLCRHDGEPRRAMQVGTLALLLVLPITAHAFFVFRPSSQTIASQAASILVEERIPHHAVPSAWFAWPSVVKVALMGAAPALIGRSRLRPVLLTPLATGASLSLLQLATDSHWLALLFPWRLSTLLVPLCVAVLLGKGLTILSGWIEGRTGAPRRGTLVLLVSALLLAGAGLARTALLAEAQARDPASALFEYVRRHRQPDDRYLIPPKLQRFRLATGAPAFADFKAIPYRDVEVIAWDERLELAEFFYRDDPALIHCGLLDQIFAIERITHVVLERDQFGLDCPGLTPLYEDDSYALFRYQQ